MAWLCELACHANSAPLYYVEVEAEKVEKGKWSSILPQIVVYEPYRIRRLEKVKEVSWKEASFIYNARFRIYRHLYQLHQDWKRVSSTF